MGKKKPKETEPESHNGAVLSQSGIFGTLFAVDNAGSTGVSNLFSDKNPFRRKPSESKPAGDDKKSGFADSDGRRDKEKKRHIDSDSPVWKEGEEIVPASAAADKRSKKDKNSILVSGSDVNGGSNDSAEENPNVSILKEGKSKTDVDLRKKKKRKRDEIEKEYEEKKYGSVSEDGEEKEKKVGEKRKKADEMADTMVPKEGFDDESKLLRTVFVGNLPLKVNKKVILKEFNKFGEVESVRIRSVPLLDTKKTRRGAIMQKQINENASSVHAYVVFKTEHSAEASLAQNMSLIGGNHIRVDRACPPRKKLKGPSTPLYDPKRTVFVGNLPFDVKDEELYQLFTGNNNLADSVEAIRVIRDPHVSIGKGIAYVLFKTRDAANLVIKKGNLKLRDRKLRVSHAKSNSTPSKRKNHTSFGSDADSPAKKLAMDRIASSSGKDSERSNRKATPSYQGLRATKSEANKRKSHQKSPGSVKTDRKRRGDKAEKTSERTQKRPAVAARKAKAKGLKEIGFKQAGTKRKQDNRTPESFSRKKRQKRS